MLLLKEIHFFSSGFLFVVLSRSYHEQLLWFVAWSITTVIFSFPLKFFTSSLTDGFSLESEQDHFSLTLLTMLASFNSVVVKMVSILPLFLWFFGSFLSAQTMIGITVTFMFQKSFSYLTIFGYLYSFCLLSFSLCSLLSLQNPSDDSFFLPYDYHYWTPCEFLHQRQMVLFHWSQVYRILLSILADLNKALLCIVSILLLISTSASLFSNPLETVPRVQIINSMYHWYLHLPQVFTV